MVGQCQSARRQASKSAPWREDRLAAAHTKIHHSIASRLLVNPNSPHTHARPNPSASAVCDHSLAFDQDTHRPELDGHLAQLRAPGQPEPNETRRQTALSGYASHPPPGRPLANKPNFQQTHTPRTRTSTSAVGDSSLAPRRASQHEQHQHFAHLRPRAEQPEPEETGNASLPA
ncbi:hypothetical protein D9611_013160 [Ephemerocybe angulata]|uniref:Uncharacterized protein n=1 Tax=Ephemerocybe angulata TaxID=980116 RepID=A0A8H5BTD5_9AGAR|nr:hypothetical protein D9611_013160 [Tulosesus angulatus]